MMIIRKIVACCSLFTALFLLCRCHTNRPDEIKPVVITQPVKNDTDDPAIWVNPADASKSLIIGTDKDTDGGLYVFDLQGKIVKRSTVLKRPDNVDVAYGILLGKKSMDIAVTTERETNKLRVFALPGLQEIDAGGIPVFADEKMRSPMGIAMYTRPIDKKIFAIVSRKTGPAENYLFQYELLDNGKGQVTGKLVRKFGRFSGVKEIESIAVDNELGYVYYSDERFGIHKYYANPAKGNSELAVFGQSDFKGDMEGISIYKAGDKTGYILISDQQAQSFNVYPREGISGKANSHPLLAKIPVAALESDGSESSSISFGPQFPKGIFVAMSTDKTFHIYDWRNVSLCIPKAK